MPGEKKLRDGAAPVTGRTQPENCNDPGCRVCADPNAANKAKVTGRTEETPMRDRFENWVGRALPRTAIRLRADGLYADPTIEMLWKSWEAASEPPTQPATTLDPQKLLTEYRRTYKRLERCDETAIMFVLDKLAAAAPTGQSGAELLSMLKELVEISSEANIPLVNSKAVRKMGKFLDTWKRAKDLIERLEASAFAESPLARNLLAPTEEDNGGAQ